MDSDLDKIHVNGELVKMVPCVNCSRKVWTGSIVRAQMGGICPTCANGFVLPTTTVFGLFVDFLYILSGHAKHDYYCARLLSRERIKLFELEQRTVGLELRLEKEKNASLRAELQAVKKEPKTAGVQRR